MADIRLQAIYHVINYDNGKFLEKDDLIDSFTFYSEERGTNVTLNNVSIIDIDEYNITFEDDNNYYDCIKIDDIIDFDY